MKTLNFHRWIFLCVLSLMTAGCTNQNAAIASLQTAEEVIQNYEARNDDNYRISTVSSCAIGQTVDEQNTEHTIQTAENLAYRGNHSFISSSVYDDSFLSEEHKTYRTYQNNTIEQYEHSSDKDVWQKTNLSENPADFHEFMATLSSIPWSGCLSTKHGYTLTAEAENCMDLFPVLYDTPEQKQAVAEKAVKFYFDLNCRLTRIELADVHWENSSGNTYQYMMYTFSMNFTEYNQVEAAEVKVPAEVRKEAGQ